MPCFVSEVLFIVPIPLKICRTLTWHDMCNCPLPWTREPLESSRPIIIMACFNFEIEIIEIWFAFLTLSLNSLKVCQGSYDAALIKAWEEWDEKNGSENDHPKQFSEKQVYDFLFSFSFPFFFLLLIYKISPKFVKINILVYYMGSHLLSLQSFLFLSFHFQYTQDNWIFTNLTESVNAFLKNEIRAMLCSFWNMVVRILRASFCWTLMKHGAYSLR